jgi:hypothetical protein
MKVTWGRPLTVGRRRKWTGSICEEIVAKA